MASSRSVPSVRTSAASSTPSTSNRKHDHVHRRIFIGPMPEKVISQTETQTLKRRRKLGLFRSFTSDSNEQEQQLDDMSQLARDHAFKFFIQKGGRAESWDEAQEQGMRDELIRRWKDSEWGKVWSRREKHKTQAGKTPRWVGASFEVGDLLGVNILEETAEIEHAPSVHSKSQIKPRTEPAISTNAETFVTARTEASPTSAPPFLLHVESPIEYSAGVSNIAHSTGESLQNSQIGLLAPKISPRNGLQAGARTEVIRRPSIKLPSSFGAHSDTRAQDQNFVQKSKKKIVRYADSLNSVKSSPAADPIPPSEVLERTGSEVEGTSAGAAAEAMSPTDDTEWGDVIMKDRMLVRVSYTKSEALGNLFDESRNRTTQHLQFEDWSEYFVVWRMNRIELYEDYTTPMKEMLVGHKHLAHVIPISPSKTTLSMYSFVDMTFCITAPPTISRSRSASDKSKSRSIFRRDKEGTNIFVFKVRSRSRAVDWLWRLWRQLGNDTPATIEVHNPSMDTRVRIDVPWAENNQQIMMNRQNIISLCMHSLKSVHDWKNLLERQLEQGKTLELAWRLDTNLDWIWLEDDVNGRARTWEVLSGLAMKQSIGAASLEVRLSEHLPDHVRLKDGTRLLEPPSIEGYLDRIKPNTQIKSPVYLVTHNGNLFSLIPSHAYPPSPPGLEAAATTFNPETNEYEDASPSTLRRMEVQRGGMQIMHASSVSDLRSIIAVRRAFQHIASHTHEEMEQSGDVDLAWSQALDRHEELEAGDAEDAGGEDGLGKVEDKPTMKMRRSFELLLKNGRVVRFEAYSCKVAIEWIERLRALVLFWKHRHRVDAREEMELAESTRPLLTPRVHAHCNDAELPPEPPIDITAPIPALSGLYNWCVLDGCRPVVRGGSLFTRRGLRGQYRPVQMFLVAGNIFLFRVNPRSTVHPAKRKKINLNDAYVCSGYFAALTLPSGQYDASAPSTPRRYADGLETEDSDEDTLFMILYRPQTPSIDGEKHRTAPQNVPALSAKRQLVVFRTRSKLERDAWCWAINCEIEKLVRTASQREKEEKMREIGLLARI